MSQVVYELVTKRILEALERGVVPWRKPWNEASAIPRNAVSRRPYSGINLLLLGLGPYRDPRFLTFDQAKQLGGTVRKGERSSVAVFWKQLEVDEQSEQRLERCPRRIPLLRYYRLFNVEQVDGLKLQPLPEVVMKSQNERVDAAEAMIRSMPDPPRILQNGKAAWYRPSDDTVCVPPIEAFQSADHFYATLFHELGHATGHERRLNRPGVTGAMQFGSAEYSREELIAELASAYCCASLELDNSLVCQSASYIQGWIGAIESDSRALVGASAGAHKAHNWIIGE